MTITLSLLMLASAQQNIEQLVVPDAFHGAWDWNVEGCKASLNDSRMSISAKKISYWESDGEPAEILRSGQRDISVTLSMSGEGETWQSKTRFVLSEDGQQLFAEALPLKGTEYYHSVWFYTRCVGGATHDEERAK